MFGRKERRNFGTVLKLPAGMFFSNVPMLGASKQMLRASKQRRNMQARTITIAIMCILLAVAIAAASQKTGAADMTLDGGKTGAVQFPHKAHQDNLKDCNICHDVFPQEKGAIDKLKAEGKLAAKQVMNTQCLKCHRDNKKAGKPSGPTGCTKCHGR